MQAALPETSLMAQHKETQRLSKRRKLIILMKIFEKSKNAFDGRNFCNHFYIKNKMEIYSIFQKSNQKIIKQNLINISHKFI